MAEVWEDAPYPDLVKTVPHVAFEVENMDGALKGQKVIIKPNSPSEGLTVAFIEVNGVPIELMQYKKSPSKNAENRKMRSNVTIPGQPERENRIHDEAVVDAYGEEERAMGWYYYLDDRLNCPFKALCKSNRIISPLQEGEHVEVAGLAPVEECMTEVFVKVRGLGREFAVPLSQVQPIEVDEETQQAIEDWHYWVAKGYQF